MVKICGPANKQEFDKYIKINNLEQQATNLYMLIILSKNN